MDKLEPLLSKNIALDNQLEDYFEAQDSYADPCLVCIKYQQGSRITLASINQFLQSKFDHGIEIFTLDDGCIFFALDLSVKHIKTFCTALLQQLAVDNLIVHISAFRHNPLGSPWETLDWSFQLLQETKQRSPNNSAVSYNDFCDDDNWPGIEKYCDDDD